MQNTLDNIIKDLDHESKPKKPIASEKTVSVSAPAFTPKKTIESKKTVSQCKPPSTYISNQIESANSFLARVNKLIRIWKEEGKNLSKDQIEEFQKIATVHVNKAVQSSTLDGVPIHKLIAELKNILETEPVFRSIN